MRISASNAFVDLTAESIGVDVVCLLNLQSARGEPLWNPACLYLPYVAFGWLAVGAIAWQARLLSNVSLALLISGALVYTAGLKFYLAPGKHRFSHAGWHLFVVAGSAVHATAAFV